MNLLNRFLRALLPAALFLGSGAASAQPPAAVSPAPGKALVILHTRVAAERNIPEGQLVFRPYDRTTGRLGGKGFNPPGGAFSVGRWIGFVSNKGQQNWKGWAIEVKPGSYVLAAVANPNLQSRTGPMLARSWAFDVAPGTIAYVSDYTLRWTKLHKGWGLDVVPEADEARARAFAATKTQSRAPFVAVPLRPVLLSRDAVDQKKWVVREAP